MVKRANIKMLLKVKKPIKEIFMREEIKQNILLRTQFFKILLNTRVIRIIKRPTSGRGNVDIVKKRTIPFEEEENR